MLFPSTAPDYDSWKDGMYDQPYGSPFWKEKEVEEDELCLDEFITEDD